MQDEILKEFIEESKTIVQDAKSILVRIQENLDLYPDLSKYSNAVDRIMGGSATVALGFSKDHPLHIVTDYTLTCKVLSVQLIQFANDKNLLKNCLMMLIETTEIVEKIIASLHLPNIDVRNLVPPNFIERVKELSIHFQQSKKSL